MNIKNVHAMSELKSLVCGIQYALLVINRCMTPDCIGVCASILASELLLTIFVGIENVFHALALDEYRTAFGPTLFYRPDEGMKHEWMRTFNLV